MQWRTCSMMCTLVAFLVSGTLALGVSVRPDEIAEATRWCNAKFARQASVEVSQVGLTVLANHDPVQSNGRAGQPLKIADRQYRHGLYCHAPSKIMVRLPGPGQTFSALIGVDSNEQTTGGRGSVVFVVSLAGKEVFRSALMREGMTGVPVQVDLGGASEFILEIIDGGDGISCDQADWAEASVRLADDRELPLGDLPILNRPREPYSTEPSFSFVYGGRPFRELLPGWKVERQSEPLDAQRTQHMLSFTDPKTNLVVRCVGIAYHDFPTVEWTLYFRNDGPSDTPVIEAIAAIDTTFSSPAQGDFLFRYNTGDMCTADSYQPHAEPMPAGAEKHIVNVGGRPTHTAFPYFNLTWPGEGVIVVLSWAGQWATHFARDEAGGVRVVGGQELTRFKLHPGEEVRGPMVVAQFYKGDWLRGQNLWRRWMIAHNLPRPGGKLPPVQMAGCSSHQFGEMIHADTQSQILFIDRYREEQLGLDYWWMDAGWYWNKTGWPNTGTWEVDTNRFPGGLRPICDHAHAGGQKTIVWFEPERVTPDTWLYEQHPEWLLGPDGEQKLLDLGNPEARQWLTDHVDRLITEQGIDLYRQDFNMDPLAYWRANDTPDRQGITEIRHITGYFAYWDELRRRHPDMLIDSCASGGRRNDLETLRRAVPLLRSDYIIEPVGNQGHTYGLSFWLPYYGTGSGAIDAYMYRSVMCPHFIACYDMRRQDLDYDLARRLLGQWRKVAPCFFGDYYPLTPYSLSNDTWIAWQFDRPEQGDGFLQAFRRGESIYESARLRLHGLDPAASYEVTDLDSGQTVTETGEELMNTGCHVTIESRPGAALIGYRRQPPHPANP